MPPEGIFPKAMSYCQSDRSDVVNDSPALMCPEAIHAPSSRLKYLIGT